MTATHPVPTVSVPATVKAVLGELTPASLAAELRNEEDSFQKLIAVMAIQSLTHWESDQSAERALRRLYAISFLCGLGGEVLIASSFLLLIGLGWVKVEQWTANIFFAAVYTQVALSINYITKYLFVRNPKALLPTDFIAMLPKTPAAMVD